MLQQTGNEGMITVNYAYARYSTSANPVAAAAHLAADWVRYDNGRTRYREIGNENDGKLVIELMRATIKMDSRKL
jgi:predicted ABC-type ATPase